MRRTLSRLIPLALLAGCLALSMTCAKLPSETPTPKPQDGVFLHISSGPESPHRVLMALRMAEIMAEDRDVLVYFDIDGIGVVVADAPDLQHATFPSSHGQIQTLLDLGVPLFACPGCLEAAGKTPEDLRPGIEVANKDAFFDFTDGRILTLDY